MNLRFKIKIISFFLMLFVSQNIQAQSDEKEIRETIFAQQEAWNNADIDGFMAHYWNSDSLQFVSKNGVTHGWEKVKNNYKKNYNSKAKMGVLTFEKLKIDLLTSHHEQNILAHITGSWKVEQEDKNILSGYFSLIMKKINGKWLIIIDHTS